jgi:biotin-dependent carboxylase-like uncharacterized protein
MPTPTEAGNIIEVIKPGLATSVQDKGRTGYYHVGIPPSGSLDQFSACAANLLVGNDEGDAVLECTLLGPELRFHGNTLVAVTGAEMPPKVDGQPQPANEAFLVKAGQVLSFGYIKRGARAYIAVAGGIDVPVVLGSRSTYALGAFGGHHGRSLRKGDQLPVGKVCRVIQEGKSLPESMRAPLSKEVQLRVLPGLYYHRLTDESAAAFFADVWSVASEADRIGYRYRGGRAQQFREREQPFGAGADPSNIVDAGYPVGSIQVPGGLEPIILHRDAVSGGGYATIGAVISADMDLIGQMQPSYHARFVPVTIAQALAERHQAALHFAALRAALQD